MRARGSLAGTSIEGVDGSSPSEGFQEPRKKAGFLSSRMPVLYVLGNGDRCRRGAAKWEVHRGECSGVSPEPERLARASADQWFRMVYGLICREIAGEAEMPGGLITMYR